jgi:hypothetical protein
MDEDRSPTSETVAHEGFPEFRHSQWTVEGEIERMQALGIAGARATGWKRGVALFLVVLFLLPFILTIVTLLARAL